MNPLTEHLLTQTEPLAYWWPIIIVAAGGVFGLVSIILACVTRKDLP